MSFHLEFVRGLRQWESKHQSFLLPRVATRWVSWQVSSLGRVKTTHGSVSYGYERPDGYYSTTIKRKTVSVHRLVAHAFLGPPPTPAQWQVHHKDGKRSNNAVEHLEYVTPSQNTRYAYEMNLARKACVQARSQPVIARELGADHWFRYASISEASRALGSNRRAISRCCDGLLDHTHGYECRRVARAKPELLQGESWRMVLEPEPSTPLIPYEVSCRGRIKYLEGRVGWGNKTLQGYYTATIRTKKFQVHRLVARAFLGPIPSQEQRFVNHKDGDKGHNAIENLEYVTQGQNVKHSYDLSLRKSHGGIRRSRPVWARTVDGDDWCWYSSMTQAAQHLQVGIQGVSSVCNGKQFRTGGYTFKIATRLSSADLPGEIWRDVDIE